MNSIVICEKADQAANIRAAVGETYGRVLPASGHLYALAEPDSYGGDWTDWAGFHVYKPPVWKKVPTPGNDEQHQRRLDQARSAITSALKSASRVYIATDCDREGEVIGREILDENGYRGEVFRVLFNADDPASLREAFAAPVPIAKREAIYQAGLARERADYIWNFSLTRAVTSALIKKGKSGVIGIGRVKTPTLAIVARREFQISQWKPSESHVIRLTIDTDAGPVELTSSADQIFPNKASAEAAAKDLPGKEITLAVETSRKKQGPPKPPDLTVLQTTASRWGWPADKTLAIGQALYSTHKIMTYVRASTRYYPEPAIANVPEMLASLGQLDAYRDLIPAKPVIRTGKAGIFCDEALAGESHYGLMPNVKTMGEIRTILLQLSPDEAQLFDLVCRLYLQTIMPDHEYEATKATADFSGLSYSKTLRRPLVPGWKAAKGGEADEGGKEEDEPELMKPLAGGVYRIIKAEPRPRQATAPRRYTQGSLISAMLNAWQFVKDEQLKARLKDAKGIGTVATRDDVIRGLIEQKQIKEDKSTLAPSGAGYQLFETLLLIDPRLADPGTTAEWEMRIDAIARGEMPLENFLQDIANETGRLVEKIKAQPPNDKFGEARPVTDAMAKAVEAVQKKTGKLAPPGWRADATLVNAYLDKFGTGKKK
ncbi:MAG: DNA topoisomerase III [Betaproteobacteria bacterium]|nr:DNA topoisomerase III [Betaproteobacteria bacterium]